MSDPELRQIPISEATLHNDGDASWHQYVLYCPGNGSRYLVRFDRIAGPQWLLEELGSSPDATMVTDMLRGTSFVCQPGTNYLAPEYVAEKLRCSLVDGRILAELIGQYTTRRVDSASALDASDEQTFCCGRCHRNVPWSKGAADEWPDLCDDCAEVVGYPHADR